MSHKIESKTFTVELKADRKQRTVEGHAAVFGNVDSYDDIVLPGAFAKTIAEKGHERPYLWNHDWLGFPLGHTVELREDSKGLFYRASIADTEKGEEYLKLVEHRSVREASFAFVDDDSERDGEGHRLLKSLDLLEVSGVLWGANDQATVQLSAKGGLYAISGGLQMLANAREMYLEALQRFNNPTSSWDTDATEDLEAAWRAELQRFINEINSLE